MTKKIICAGYGGQGALVAGLMMAHAAVEMDREILWLSSYGGEMRGGSANCSLTISDSEIFSPYVNEMDILLAMNQISLEKFESMVKPNGVMIVNRSLLLRPYTYRTDINIIEVEANDIANNLKNPRGVNMVMLGALARWSDLFDEDYLCEACNQYFVRKGKNNPKNIDCFKQGADQSLKI